MEDNLRKRALDDIEVLKDQWLSHNPLFHSCIPEFDESFDRGVPPNLDYYITHPLPNGGSFEEDMCRVLFSTHSNPTGKVYVLEGGVGLGKTCFARYLAERQIPKSRPGTLSIYVDAWQMFQKGRERGTLADAFLARVARVVTDGPTQLFTHQKDYYAAVLSHFGYDDLSAKEVFELRDKLSVPDVLEFLIELDESRGILIILDNLDENPDSGIQEGYAFALQLADLARSSRKKACSILIPLREYTANQFFDTERFAHRILPPADEAQIVGAKLEQSRDLIAHAANDFSHEFSYTMVGESQELIMRGTRVTITRQGVCDFLKELADYLLSVDEPAVLSHVRQLSAGNLKILVGNTYNLLHSNKLPLIPLFQQVFRPADAVEARTHPVLVPPELALECLMVIHYPFYDSAASHIINIFNARSSTVPNNFQNTLVIPRILCLLLNAGALQQGNLLERLDQLGYSRSYVDEALRKCLHYGLIMTDCGNKLEHIGTSTIISASSAAAFYIETLLFEPTYLQYVCEDTPMPHQFCVPITEKYDSPGMQGSRVNRLSGAEKLILFIADEEKREKQNWSGGVDEAAFLFEMSVREGDRGRQLGDLIATRVLPRIHKISESRSRPA